MTTKICKHCKKEVDSKATRCSYCQGDLRSWFARHPILTILLVLFILGIFGSAIGTDKTSTTTQKTTSTTETSAEPTKVEAMKIDALEFVTEFDKNQLKAEEKYNDKVIELTAVIKNISEDIAGSPFLSLEPQGNEMFGTSIQCLFKDKSTLTSVENGNIVVVQGKVSSQSLGIIILKDCNLMN